MKGIQNRNEFLERKRIADASWFIVLPIFLIFIGILWYYRLIQAPFIPLLKTNLAFTAIYILLHLFIERKDMDILYIQWLTLISFFVILLQITANIHFLGGAEAFIFYPLYLGPIITSGLIFSGGYLVGCVAISSALLAILFILEEPSIVWYLVNMGAPRGLVTFSERFPLQHYPAFGFDLTFETTLTIFLSYLFTSMAFAIMAHSAVHLLERVHTRAIYMEKDIKGREDLFNLSLLHAPTGFVIGYRSNYRPIYVNRSVVDTLGITDEDTKGRDIFSLFSFEPDMAAFLKERIDSGEPMNPTIAPITRRDGTKAFFQIKLSLLNYPTPTGEEELFILIASNVTEELELSNIITNSRDAVILLDRSGIVQLYNRSATQALPHLSKGASFRQAVSPGVLSSGVVEAVIEGLTVDGKVQLGEKTFFFSSSLLKDAKGMELGILFSLKDITNEEVFYNLSTKDELTGLYNRRFFFDTLEKGLAQASRYDKPITLAILDIDFFKKINDTYGHNAGDIVLKRFAMTIAEKLRKANVLARTGGEEFAIYMPFIDIRRASKFCESLREEVERLEIEAEGYKMSITCSIGLAEYKRDDSVIQLMAKADAALYEAKRTGRNRVVVFSDSIVKAHDYKQ